MAGESLCFGPQPVTLTQVYAGPNCEVTEKEREETFTEQDRQRK